ncbi:hypothetical protein [Geodermatophilus marinus]|uniref:hypothetical protein n=1 Tax=Geodermatophilus sp. LHW52908 TaxID=2303986 RepID=UPI0013141A36|nr:hypothetical protein [Geodermatophilus sp. LHW52908]
MSWVSHALFLVGGPLIGYALARLTGTQGADVGQVIVPAAAGLAALVVGQRSAVGRT